MTLSITHYLTTTDMNYTKYFRLNPISFVAGAYHLPGIAHEGIPRIRRHGIGRWLAAAVTGGLFLTLLMHGAHHPSDTQELDWLSRLAADDDAGAQLQLGLAYRNGHYGLEPDARTAQYWLDRAARNGQPYYPDPGLRKQPIKSESAAVDQSRAARPVASSKLDALATELDSPTLAVVSAIWKTLSMTSTAAQSSAALEQRAQSGDPVSEFQLATRYRDGAWAVNRDPAKAYYWLRRSADAGNPVAMRALAEVYRTGDLGIERDPAGAARWEKRAAVAAASQAG